MLPVWQESWREIKYDDDIDGDDADSDDNDGGDDDDDLVNEEEDVEWLLWQVSWEVLCIPGTHKPKLRCQKDDDDDEMMKMAVRSIMKILMMVLVLANISTLDTPSQSHS